MHRILYLFISIVFCIQLRAQSTEAIEAIEDRMKLVETSIFNDYPVRNIGPVVQSARVTDIVVSKSNSKIFYVAYASGGVYKTVNNGITQEPIFDHQGALNIGDMALAPSDDNILYVGTGENNSSRSSYAGSGIYKTINAGNSWVFIGLPNIHHSGRIIVHPLNPDIVWVAALGALYSHNEDRGIYKSTDGGKSWIKKLYVNDSTGFIDLIIHPKNPDVLWASSWERTRKAGNFKGHGIGSGIYKSTDGGETWNQSMKNFPKEKYNGRIGLDISASNPEVLYAILDNQTKKNQKKIINKSGLLFQDFNTMSLSAFQNLDNTKLEIFLRDNEFPSKYTAAKLKEDIKNSDYTIQDIANYSGDANKELYNTQIIGAEVYRSNDAGTSWFKTNSYDLDGVYNSYGYYFGEIRVSPDNEDEIYILGVPLLTSKDGGQTFERLAEDVHADQQAFWIDNKDPEHQLLGNDGGLYISYDRGSNWIHMNTVSNGQFYTVNVDMAEPYNVYGGLQDNGVMMGSSKSTPNATKKWEKLVGGDGMFIATDPRDQNIVYTGFQFGNYYRFDLEKGTKVKISPQHNIGETKLRFNWRSPIVSSKHNADILYFGAQKLFRSMDRGENWETLSGDLTKNHPQGNVPYSTITCIAESPMKFGIIYIGTDDGNIQLTKNGGATWELVSEDLPKDLWVSSLSTSSHNIGLVYATFTGYRSDDFSSHLFKSDDFGKSWKSLKSNLPSEAVNVILEDPVNPDLLYLGTDHGTYISLDKGKVWNNYPGIPNAASYDMVIHPRENELVIATHGRGIYVIDVKPLQSLSRMEDIKLFPIDSIVHSALWGKSRFAYLKPIEPKMTAMYFISSDAREVTFKVYNREKQLLSKQVLKNTRGFHMMYWDLKATLDKKGKTLKIFNYVDPGVYTIKVSADGKTSETIFKVEEASH